MSSRIYKLNREKFQILCNQSNTLSDILRALNLRIASGNYRTIKRRIKKDNIDVSHIPLGINSNKHRSGKVWRGTKIPLSDILVQNCPYKIRNQQIVKRIFEEAIWDIHECFICNLKGLWNNKPLVLRLDHINGIHNDNRIENLRLVCPNCDSQLDTFGTKNIKKRLENQKFLN